MSARHASKGGRRAGLKTWGVGFAVGAALLVGCVVDSSPTSSNNSGGVAYGGGPVFPDAGAGTATPVLVQVDTDQTLETTPGQGIGVYVEYATGGHWNVSWTCDTALTSLTCSFMVTASVAAGAITDPTAMIAMASDAFTLEPSGGASVSASSTTTSGADGFTFDTAPGARITVNVGLNAPVSFFFVQDGKVNGGYQGPLANPLMFEPSTP